MQNTSHILMIRPLRFGFNVETAINNAFQLQGHGTDAQTKALTEFDNLVKKLSLYEIDVTVWQDTPEPYTPDSIFPNNWISFHSNGKLCLYPMFAKNRRAERNQTIIDMLKSKFIVNEIIDFTQYENEDKFLEGTGSMVLDREHKIVYACLSPRTHRSVGEKFCNDLGYKPCFFTAVDTNDNEIYHTNVMLSVCQQYVIVCLESIKNTEEQKEIIATFQQTGKEIIEISLEQMKFFAGNMLQVKNIHDEQFLVMSSTAFRALTSQQISAIRRYNNIIDSELDVIEKNGGGSARCMLAEIFLEKK